MVGLPSQARSGGLKLVFCGTPRFAVPTLDALLAQGHEVALVVSQPDRAAGRHHQPAAPPVKQTALARGLDIRQPDKIRSNAEFRAELERIAPQAIVVVAYGRIIPPWMLAVPALGCINLHASLLPKYRGAAPIQWAIASGDAYTGNTTMLLEEGLDTGPILLQQTQEIAPDQTAVELAEILAHTGAPLVVKTLTGLADRTITPQPQNPDFATFAPILDRQDGWMDLDHRSAGELYNRWRGFQPWPGAFTMLDGKKLIVHRMQVASGLPGALSAQLEPGRVVLDAQRLLVQCAAGTWLELVEVQLEGRRRLSAPEFLRGHPMVSGARLG
jgi:methionyl-tRNA formyltransferase